MAYSHDGAVVADDWHDALMHCPHCARAPKAQVIRDCRDSGSPSGSHGQGPVSNCLPDPTHEKKAAGDYWRARAVLWHLAVMILRISLYTARQR
jgi:hypothetical protein